MLHGTIRRILEHADEEPTRIYSFLDSAGRYWFLVLVNKFRCGGVSCAPPHCCCGGSMETCSVIYSVGEYCGQRESAKC